MNTNLDDKIYNTLKVYLQAKSSYSPRVLKFAKQEYDKFPLVVLTEVNNVPNWQTLKAQKRETVADIYYEVNIYATDKIAGNTTISRVQICEELQSLTDKVMSNYFQLERTLCQPTPNLDTNIYRITLRYTAKLYENRERLI